MNRLVLSSSVAAACAAMSGGALALPLNTYVAGADTLEIRISGASAQDVALEKAMAGVCVSGSLNGANQLNNSVYFCTIAPGTAPNPGVSTIITFPGVPASVNKLVLYKSSIGGSGNGVAPVANSQTNMQFLNLATLAANPGCLGANVNFGAGALPAYTMQPVVQVASCTILQNAVPDAGLSDVEPSLLGASPAVVAFLTRFEGGHLTFGFPVTRNLRDDLQASQSLPVGSDAAADQPSIGSFAATALYNGSITNFADIGGTGNVSIAFRSGTSGTTRTFNAYFATDAGQCTLNARARRGVTSGDTTGSACEVAGTAGIVIQGSGTDNVVRCMAGHQANGRRAIGVLSTEVGTLPAGQGTNASFTQSDAIRFIRLDGQLPTLVNVANGRYGLWASTSFQYRNAASGNPLAGDKLTGTETLRGYLASKAVLGDVNSTIVQTFAAAGDVGYLAAPSAGNLPPALPVTAASLAANLTNPFTEVNANVQNNCQRGIKFNP